MRFPFLLLVAVACSKRPPPAPDPGEQRAEAVADKLINTPAPALTVATLDGSSIDLAKLYGTKPVYLKFWATWCEPCREQMPKFEQLYETLGDRVTIIAVNVGLDDTPDAVRAFRDAHGLRMPIVIDDGRLAAALDLQVTPQHVLIDRSARISFVGHRDGDALDRALARALEKPTHSTVAPNALAPTRPLHVGERVTDPNLLARIGASNHRPKAIVFFATWCESYLAESQPTASQDCKRVRADVDALREARRDVDWIGVATGLWSSPEDVRAYVTETGTRLPIVFDRDGTLFHAFDVHELGTVILLDGDGTVLRVVRPDDDLRDSVASL